MSVIIRGMKMPTSCNFCPFLYAGKVCVPLNEIGNHKGNRCGTDYESYIYERHEKCPLVELPVGRWVNDSDDELPNEWACSLCHQHIESNVPFLMRYCPFCGAKMGGES